MDSSPHIWVQTSFFQAEPGEDEFTNPGIYGCSLANWIAEKLRDRNEPVQRIISEDWGWCIILNRKPYAVWIGCSNRNGRTDEWGVFVAVEPSIFQKVFGQSDVKKRVDYVFLLLKEIMNEVPGFTKVWVEGNDQEIIE
jgi:hypothetical protein